MQKLLKVMTLVLVVAVMGVSFVGCGTKNSGKVKIGIFVSAQAQLYDDLVSGFKDAIASAGIDADYVEQNATGDNNLAAQIAQSMVSQNVDFILTCGTTATQAAVAAVDGKIPIVFGGVMQPVAAGAVVDMENSTKENVTGVTDALDFEAEASLLKQLVPNAKKIGGIYNPNEPAVAYSIDGTLKSVMERDGYEFSYVPASSANEIPTAVDTAVAKYDAMIQIFTNTIGSATSLIAEKALAAGVPVIGSDGEQVQDGFLCAQELSYYKIGQMCGNKMAQIAHGTKAYDLPIENGTKNRGDLVINKATADKLGIDISGYPNATIVGE